MESEKEGAVEEISAAQVLADIEAALGLDDVVDDPNAKTVPELLKQFTGISERTLQRKLVKAVKSGVMERVRVLMSYEGGGQTRWWAYRVREQ